MPCQCGHVVDTSSRFVGTIARPEVYMNVNGQQGQQAQHGPQVYSIPEMELTTPDPPFLLYADEQQELKFTEQHLLPVDPMSAALHQHDLAGYVTYTRKDDPFANTRYDRDPIRVPVQQSITHSFDDQNAATFNQSIHPDVQPSFAFENEHFHNPLYVPPKIVAASQRPDFRAAQPGAHMGLQGLSAHFDT